MDNWTIATYAGGNWVRDRDETGQDFGQLDPRRSFIRPPHGGASQGPKFVSRSRIEVVTSSRANSHTSSTAIRHRENKILAPLDRGEPKNISHMPLEKYLIFDIWLRSVDRGLTCRTDCLFFGQWQSKPSGEKAVKYNLTVYWHQPLYRLFNSSQVAS